MQMAPNEGFLDMCDEEFDGIWCYDKDIYVIQFENTWILINEKQYKQIVSFLNEYVIIMNKHQELDAEKEKIINMLKNVIENQSEYDYITLASEISVIYEYINKTFILKGQIAKFFEERDKKRNDIIGDENELDRKYKNSKT